MGLGGSGPRVEAEPTPVSKSSTVEANDGGRTFSLMSRQPATTGRAVVNVDESETSELGYEEAGNGRAVMGAVCDSDRQE